MIYCPLISGILGYLFMSSIVFLLASIFSKDEKDKVCYIVFVFYLVVTALLIIFGII